jgi:hypothetical protein
MLRLREYRAQCIAPLQVGLIGNEGLLIRQYGVLGEIAPTQHPKTVCVRAV